MSKPSSDIASIQDEAAADAVLKLQIQERERTRALIAPTMKKLQNAKEVEIKMEEARALAEVTRINEEELLANQLAHATLSEVTMEKREKLSLLFKNENAMDMCLEKHWTESKV